MMELYRKKKPINLTVIQICSNIKVGERGNGMFLSQTDREMLSNLKGRISKLLSGTKVVSVEEKAVAERTYRVIDEIILWNKQASKAKCEYFKKALTTCKEVLEESDKKYILNHIVPLLSKILDREW